MNASVDSQRPSQRASGPSLFVTIFATWHNFWACFHSREDLPKAQWKLTFMLLLGACCIAMPAPWLQLKSNFGAALTFFLELVLLSIA